MPSSAGRTTKPRGPGTAPRRYVIAQQSWTGPRYEAELRNERKTAFSSATACARPGHRLRSSAMRYLVLTLVCLAAVIAYVQRTALTVPTRTIQDDLDISERGMGLVL